MEFRKNLPFKSYGVESQYANELELTVRDQRNAAATYLVPRPFLRTREEFEIRGRRKAQETSGKSSRPSTGNWNVSVGGICAIAQRRRLVLLCDWGREWRK